MEDKPYTCVVYSYLPINLDFARFEAFVGMVGFINAVNTQAFTPKTVTVTTESGEKIQIEEPADTDILKLIPSGEDIIQYNKKCQYFYAQYLHYMYANKSSIEEQVRKRQIFSDTIDLAIKLHDIIEVSDNDPVTGEFLERYAEPGQFVSISCMDFGRWVPLPRHKNQHRYEEIQMLTGKSVDDVVKLENEEIKEQEIDEPRRRISQMKNEYNTQSKFGKNKRIFDKINQDKFKQMNASS